MINFMRTFLAVSPPIQLARELYSARSEFRDVWKGVRWVKAELFHITLVFLGDRDDSVVREVTAAVGPALEGLKAFDIGFEGVGCFGSPTRPKIFFENVGIGRDDLEVLHSALGPILENLTGLVDRNYTPHMTLGRPMRHGVQGPADGGLLPSGVKTDNVGTFRAREVTLFQSILHADGARYVPLESWPLKEAS